MAALKGRCAVDPNDVKKKVEPTKVEITTLQQTIHQRYAKVSLVTLGIGLLN